MEWAGEGVFGRGGGRQDASADPAGLALEARLGGGNAKGRGGPRPATSPPPPPPGLRAGSGGQQGAPEDRHCLAEDLPGLGRCPARDPPPDPGSASQTRRGTGPRGRRARGKQGEPSGARKPVPGSGGREVTAVNLRAGAPGCPPHTQGLRFRRWTSGQMHNALMGSRKAGVIKQTCKISDIYVNTFRHFFLF